MIPEFAYPDVGEAIDWLCDTFGFTLRIRIMNHRAQLNVGDGAIVLTELHRAAETHGNVDSAHSALIRVEDVNRHHEHASSAGRDPAAAS